MTLPVRTGLCYGLGMIGERLFRDAPALLLLVYMTNYMAIPASLAGLCVFAPKVLLLALDPLVGMLSDRSQSAWGRRRPFLVAGALLSGGAFIAMFHVPVVEPLWVRVAAMMVTIGIAFSLYSLYSVPYLSLASDMAPDMHVRTRLLGYRTAFLAVGLNMSASAGALIEHVGGGRAGYQTMAWAYGLACAVTMLAPALMNEPRGAVRERQPGALRAGLRACWSNRVYRRLLLANLLQKAAEGVGYGSFAYFFLYWLGLPLSSIAACVLASTVAQILAQPFWVRLSRVWSRGQCCTLTVAGYIVVNLGWLLVPTGTFWPVPVLGFLTGAFASGMLLNFVAMMSDVAVRAKESAAVDTGLISGVWLAVEKVGFAAGGMLVGVALGVAGFVPSADGVTAQSHTVQLGIAFAYVGLGTILYLATLWVVRGVGRSDERSPPPRNPVLKPA
jgi:GPH family glycoside/pentoside/hexuronide:cation symporter